MNAKRRLPHTLDDFIGAGWIGLGHHESIPPEPERQRRRAAYEGVNQITSVHWIELCDTSPVSVELRRMNQAIDENFPTDDITLQII